MILSSRSITPCHYPPSAVASDPTGQEVVHRSDRWHAAIDRQLPSSRRALLQRPSGAPRTLVVANLAYGLSLISVSG